MSNLSKEAIEFLKANDTLVLSTLSANNQIDSSFVFYSANDLPEIFILTKTGTGKYVNVQQNPEVAFVVTDFKNLSTLQGRGSAEEITGKTGSAQAYKALLNVMLLKMPNSPPPLDQLKGDLALFKITPTDLNLRNFTT